MTKFNGHSAPSRRSIIKGAGALAAGVAAPAFLRVRSAYAAEIAIADNGQAHDCGNQTTKVPNTSKNTASSAVACNSMSSEPAMIRVNANAFSP